MWIKFRLDKVCIVCLSTSCRWRSVKAPLWFRRERLFSRIRKWSWDMLLYGNLGGRSFSKSVVYLREIVLDLLLTMWQWLRRQRARLAMFPSFVPNNSFSRLSLPGRQCWRYSPYSNRSKKIRRWKSFLPEPSRRALLGRPKPDLGSKCNWFYSTGNRSTWTVSFPKNLSIRFGLYSFRQK